MQRAGRIAVSWATLAVTAALMLPLPAANTGLATAAAAGSTLSQSTVRDRVLPLMAASNRRLTRPLVARTYHGSGDQSVKVLSSAYSPAEVQPLVDTLTSFPHGPEMDSLSLFVATPSQLDSTCGANRMACYDPYREQIVISGSPDPSVRVPRDFVLAHEYGHHIANHRRNSPWAALSWGPKRWATTMRVCSGVRSGALHPGDEGDHYWSNPGEAWAETYAHMVYPDAEVGWYFSSALTPDRRALTAARLDATRPWSGPRRLHWKFAVKRGEPRARVRILPTPLDGRLHVWIKEPKGANLTIRLLPEYGGPVLARSVDLGPREDLKFNVCGRGKVRLRVVDRRGLGRFVVRVLHP
jgi:hypothetical protein